MQNSKSPVGTADETSTKDELNPSSPTCTKPLVGGSFSSDELKPKENHLFWDAEQIENFDKRFLDFKQSINRQLLNFGLENNCRVIILDNELMAIINIRKY